MALINISGIKNTPQQEHQVLGRGGGGQFDPTYLQSQIGLKA